MYRLMTTLLLSALATGCSTMNSFQKDELAANQMKEPRQIETAQTLEEIDALKPQLKLPMRLVIAQPAWGTPWSREEVEEIESWRETLQAHGFVSELFVLPERTALACDSYRPSCYRDTDRLQAARFQADTLLEITPKIDSDKWANPASLLNLTIVGMWLVPAHHMSADVQLEGTLLDVRNEYIYAFVRAFGSESRTRPLMYAEMGDVERAARLQALRRFGERLMRDVGQ